jgi:hypothetical protein
MPSGPPNSTPTAVAVLAGGEVRPEDTNKQVGVRLDSLGFDWHWRLGRGTVR